MFITKKDWLNGGNYTKTKVLVYSSLPPKIHVLNFHRCLWGNECVCKSILEQVDGTLVRGADQGWRAWAVCVVPFLSLIFPAWLMVVWYKWQERKTLQSFVLLLSRLVVILYLCCRHVFLVFFLLFYVSLLSGQSVNLSIFLLPCPFGSCRPATKQKEHI